MPTAIHFKPEHLAILLMTTPARTDQGRKVQEIALFRVEVGMWINDALKGQ